jgi:hypothetical protein
MNHLHINRFIDRVKAAENRGQRDVTLGLQEARELHADITKLLLALQILHEQKQADTTVSTSDGIEITGGSF